MDKIVSTNFSTGMGIDLALYWYIKYSRLAGKNLKSDGVSLRRLIFMAY